MGVQPEARGGLRLFPGEEGGALCDCRMSVALVHTILAEKDCFQREFI